MPVPPKKGSLPSSSKVSKQVAESKPLKATSEYKAAKKRYNDFESERVKYPTVEPKKTIRQTAVKQAEQRQFLMDAAAGRTKTQIGVKSGLVKGITSRPPKTPAGAERIQNKVTETQKRIDELTKQLERMQKAAKVADQQRKRISESERMESLRNFRRTVYGNPMGPGGGGSAGMGPTGGGSGRKSL